MKLKDKFEPLEEKPHLHAQFNGLKVGLSFQRGLVGGLEIKAEYP